MSEDRICLPRCFEPTWRTCDDSGLVQIGCVEVTFDDECHGVYHADSDPDHTCVIPNPCFYLMTNYSGWAGCRAWNDGRFDRYGWHDDPDGCVLDKMGGYGSGAIGACHAAWLATNPWIAGDPENGHVPIDFDFVVQWECIDGDIYFQAGVSIRCLSGCLNSLSDGPDMTCQVFFCPHFEGRFSPDWWRQNIIGPGPTYGPIRIYKSDDGMLGDYIDFGVSKYCTWVPCGESTDCFPDCISGRVECVETNPPAHAPLLLTISAAEECCLTGPFPLIYDDGSHRYKLPIESTPSCEVDSDCIGPVTLTMGAELYCAAANPGPLKTWGQDDSGLAMLHIWMTDGCGDRQDFYALVILTCDGGLTPATGTFGIDTFCGDNSTNEFDWTISA